MSLDGVIVPAFGPQPSPVLLIGERPGRLEAVRRRPFIGPSGQEQQQYLARHGVSMSGWRLANVCPEYDTDNEDPSVAMLRKWTPHVEAEVATTSPKLIGAVGRYAMRWLLGEQAELDVCWGLAHEGGAFDASVAHRAQGAIVVPLVHPAAGMHDGDARGVINAGYQKFAEVYKLVKAGNKVEIRRDEYEGRQSYRDVSGKQLAQALRDMRAGSRQSEWVIGLDTEGTTANPWSLQVSLEPASALCLRVQRSDFTTGIQALQQAVNMGALIVIHNGMYDLPMCKTMGLDLFRAQLWDTMTAAYLLRLEPQGLKALSWRWCAVKMASYQETVGDVGREKQLTYLSEILERKWEKPEARVVHGNDGTAKLYQPQSVERRAESILLDAYAEGADPYERWKQVDKELRAQVEAVLGPMPTGSLDDIPLDRAIDYSCKDSDITRRLYFKLSTELDKLGLSKLMRECMDTLPAFADMQMTGLPASRQAFEKLRDEMSIGMERLQRKISINYYGGQPFNPKSHKQVAALLRRRGLEPAKRTSTGAMSTGKAAIEHLRYTDEAVAAIMEWREHQHTRDMFAMPVLELMPSGGADTVTVKPQLKITRTTTRRLASTDPNLLAFSKHEKPGGKNYGTMVRSCFVCAPGEVFCEVDLAQIESRLLAHESGDELLCQMFNENRDIHAETASHLFGVPLDKVTKVQRFFSKRVNFGIPYGVSGVGLETQLRVMGITGWDSHVCDKHIQGWHRLYKGASTYMAEVEREVSRLQNEKGVRYKYAPQPGIIEDCWGMPRHLPAVWCDDAKLAAEARRQAVNHRIQGGAQGLLQRGLAWLYPRIKDMQAHGLNVQLCLSIHDSLLLRLDEELYEDVSKLVVEALTEHNGLKMRVPCLADAKMARTWGEL